MINDVIRYDDVNKYKFVNYFQDENEISIHVDNFPSIKNTHTITSIIRRNLNVRILRKTSSFIPEIFDKQVT